MLFVSSKFAAFSIGFMWVRTLSPVVTIVNVAIVAIRQLEYNTNKRQGLYDDRIN
jgi:hypothetical protein